MTEVVDASRPDSAVRFLGDVYDAAARCNKCSLCMAVCPTYVTNPVEWETARGRVSLIRDAIEGNLELRDIADGPLSTCLTCNNCVAACAPNVPTGNIVSRARQELFDQEGQPLGRRMVLRGILPRPAALRALYRFSRLTQVTGLHALARRSGFTRFLGVAGAMAEYVGPLSKRNAYARARDLPAVREPVRGSVAYTVCCYQNVAAPEASEATMRVLLANGFSVTVPTLGCSGLPAKSLGDRDAMLEMALGTTERLRDAGKVDAYIGDVASCTGHMQSYGDIIGGDRQLGAEARRIADHTWIASTFLDARGMTAPLGPLRWRVAFDEPCSYALDDPAVRSAPYRLLAAVPQLQVVPLDEAAMCCGGAGDYFNRQRERSEAILHRKFDNVIASGADVLVTENVSCLVQLRAGARRYAPKVRVMHLFEVLEASLESARRRTAVR